MCQFYICTHLQQRDREPKSLIELQAWLDCRTSIFNSMWTPETPWYWPNSWSTVDIFKWLDFEFYDLVYYWIQPKFNMTTTQSKTETLISYSTMSWIWYYKRIAAEQAKPIAQSTVPHVTQTHTNQQVIERTSPFLIINIYLVSRLAMRTLIFLFLFTIRATCDPKQDSFPPKSQF